MDLTGFLFRLLIDEKRRSKLKAFENIVFVFETEITDIFNYNDLFFLIIVNLLINLEF
jgi:hypothetical protein